MATSLQRSQTCHRRIPEHSCGTQQRQWAWHLPQSENDSISSSAKISPKRLQAQSIQQDAIKDFVVSPPSEKCIRQKFSYCPRQSETRTTATRKFSPQRLDACSASSPSSVHPNVQMQRPALLSSFVAIAYFGPVRI